MEKVLTEIDCGYAKRCTDNGIVWSNFVKSMTENNTYIPPISRIIFNLKTVETKPVLDADGNPVKDEKGRVKRQQVAITPSLATIVYFDDGTKVSVVNSSADVVKTENKEVVYDEMLPDGKTVAVKTKRYATVATDTAKELGLVYAIVKRLYGDIDQDPKSKTYNQVKGNGFGHSLKQGIKSAYDTKYAEAFNAAMKDRAKAEHEARQKAAKEAKANRRPAPEDNLATIAKLLGDIAAKLKPEA